LVSTFFDEVTDKWFNSYDELMSWPDGRDVKYSILVDTTEQKEAQGSMLKSHASLAVRSKQVAKTNQNLQITKLELQKNINKLKVQEKELKLLASTDPLTKLYNRRYFAKVSAHILDLAKRNKKDLSVIVLDLDEFKKVNDTYGHKIGDDTLVVFADTLTQCTRKSDVICRFGGEEFVVLLPDTNIDSATMIAKKIKEAIEELIVKVDEKKEFKFTVSIGVSEVKGADSALYAAKEGGRNKIEVK